MKRSGQQRCPKVGLILTGGGARAAYQVGVLRALARLLPRGGENPFPIICGTSAGAINAAALASKANDFRSAVALMLHMWGNLHTRDVYRAGALDVLSRGAAWLTGLLFGRASKRGPASLLDNAPLATLLRRCIDFTGIQRAIDKGWLRALCVTVSGYTCGQSVSLFQAINTLTPWNRAHGIGVPASIGAKHILASSAIPFIFPPVSLEGEYCGDGSMRQLAPFSPALHLGAEKILAISVRRPSTGQKPRPGIGEFPSLAQIAGHVLDCIFPDTLKADLERVQRINHTVDPLHHMDRKMHGATRGPIDILMIAPSKEIGELAATHACALPRPVRIMMRCFGAMNRGGLNVLSYLLLERPFCRSLMRLGYEDAMARKDEILRFLGYEESSEGRQRWRQESPRAHERDFTFLYQHGGRIRSYGHRPRGDD